MYDSKLSINNIEVILPVLPLRDIVIFPGTILRLEVGRERSKTAVESASKIDQKIFLVTQKKSNVEDPQYADLYQVGVIANIVQILHLPNGRLHVLVEGLQRATLKEFKPSEDILRAAVKIVETEPSKLSSTKQESLIQKLIHDFERYIKIKVHISMDTISSLAVVDNFSSLVDIIAAKVSLPLEVSQEILAELNLEKRVEKLSRALLDETDKVDIHHDVQSKVKKQLEKNHREYILNEQLKTIQKELQEISGEQDEFATLEKQIQEVGLSAEAKEKAESELKKLRAIPSLSPEATVIRNYLDCMLKLPWKARSKIKYNLKKAQELLNQRHYGLDEIKERIIEFLAVSKRVDKQKGPILCLVGPPGVGKTSLAQSIAEATGREYVRFALGGVHDEAEIRGHRRTYIGSMPGKILQKLTKVKVNNPLFLLDEVDKMARDYRGDPASALLEVLDPEQNKHFNDHYLDVDFDLSNVLFIATANSLDIPAALLDRMEVIRLAGYTEDEKLNIATQHLLPKQLQEHGLANTEVTLSKTVIQEIIRYYTREAGVRALERQIAKICRKAVKKLLTDKQHKTVAITKRNLEEYLGVKKYHFGRAEQENRIGQVTGLAWTEMGGDLLTIEVAVIPGKGNILSTGRLGDVMQESIKAALTVVRDRAKYITLPADFHKKFDIHVHVPEGATPKDGPSAGIAMCIGLISGLTGIPVRSEVAMTGEITLRGEVLPIGGLKEKLLAAHRGGIKTVIIPEENRKDLKEIPENIKNDLDIKPVRWIDQVIMLALEYQPESVKLVPTTSVTPETHIIKPVQDEASLPLPN